MSAYSGFYSWYLMLAARAFKGARTSNRQSYASGRSSDNISLRDRSAGDDAGATSIKAKDKQLEAEAEADNTWIA